MFACFDRCQAVATIYSLLFNSSNPSKIPNISVFVCRETNLPSREICSTSAGTLSSAARWSFSSWMLRPMAKATVITWPSGTSTTFTVTHHTQRKFVTRWVYLWNLFSLCHGILSGQFYIVACSWKLLELTHRGEQGSAGSLPSIALQIKIYQCCCLWVVGDIQPTKLCIYYTGYWDRSKGGGLESHKVRYAWLTLIKTRDLILTWYSWLDLRHMSWKDVNF